MAEVEETFNFPDRQAWRDALDSAPKSGWIKSRNLGGTKKSKYVPIPVQQALADWFFVEFDVIDAKFEVITNEILCTVKINLLPSYPNSEHRTISGTGAKPIQSKSGSYVEKFPKGKITNSLEYCAPAARTMAISNALNTFANIFGRNIGRAIVSDGFNFNKKLKKDENKKS